MPLVLIDTCVWIPFFNRPQSLEKRAVDELLDDDSAVLIGPVIAEILQGISREAQADYVASLLRGVRYIEITWEDWQESARLGRRLVGAGNRLLFSDLVIAAVALRLDAEVYTFDPHFDLFAELKRHSP